MRRQPVVAKMEPGKFWAYTYDTDGDIVDDLGNFPTREDAIDAAIDSGLSEDGYDTTVAVVDPNGNTIWKAGPYKPCPE